MGSGSSVALVGVEGPPSAKVVETRRRRVGEVAAPVFGQHGRSDIHSIFVCFFHFRSGIMNRRACKKENEIEKLNIWDEETLLYHSILFVISYP